MDFFFLVVSNRDMVKRENTFIHPIRKFQVVYAVACCMSRWQLCSFVKPRLSLGFEHAVYIFILFTVWILKLYDMGITVISVKIDIESIFLFLTFLFINAPTRLWNIYTHFRISFANLLNMCLPSRITQSS